MGSITLKVRAWRNHMTLSWKIGAPSPLLAGEEVLYHTPSVGLVSSVALPNYRIFFAIRGFWRVELFLTNLRFFTAFHIRGWVLQEFSGWLQEDNPPGDKELVTAISTGRNFWGEYLEVRTRFARRPWYWLCTENIRLRFYDPGAVRAAVEWGGSRLAVQGK